MTEAEAGTAAASPVREHAAAGWAIVLALPALILAAAFAFGPDASGDGADYVASLLSWLETHRPYLTESIRRSYDLVGSSSRLPYLMPFDTLLGHSAGLRLNDTYDINHFWLYGMMAAAMALPLKPLVGLPVAVPYAFPFLHAALAAGLALLGRTLFGFRGALAVALLVIGTPALWFTTRIHTEFFTLCLTSAAVLLCLRREFIYGALCLALASTQNPSFALVAVFCGLIGFAGSGRRFTRPEGVALAAAVMMIAIHPLYFFFRYGFLNPQLGVQGAELDADTLAKVHLVFIDPDVGLLPNWPLGLVLLGAWAISLKPRLYEGGRAVVAVLIVLVAVNAFAHAINTNINHGNTIDASRYTIWYLCIFIPLLLALPDGMRTRGGSTTLNVLVIAAVAVAVWKYWPGRGETYTIPTPLSRFIQTHAPWAYRPYGEVFAERYGLGEIHDQVVVLGPDCRRAAVIVSRLPDAAAKPGLVVGRSCPLLLDRAVFQSRLVAHLGAGDNKWRIFDLPEALVMESRVVVRQPLTINVNNGLGELLDSGWWAMENWGVWSVGEHAVVRLPAIDAAAFPRGATVRLTVSGFTPRLPQAAVMRLDGGPSQRVVIERNGVLKPVDFRIAPEELASPRGRRIEIDVENPISPKEVGGSADGRRLGVSLFSVSIAPQ